jgi:CSLREA domain-containing protein
LVACFVLFSRWRGSIASANKATPSGSNRLSSTQEWRENAVLTPAVGNTITVNSSADVTNGTDGFCTLREAITAANSNTASGATAGECAAGSSGADTIDLSGLSGTITLTSVLPDISTEMSLNGPGSSVLTIQRGTQSFSISVFFISFSAKVTISGLTFQGVGGSPGSGNVGISSSGTLNLTDCVVSGFGAGIQNASQFTLTISNSVISGSLNGSGITNFSGTTNVINSTVSGNDSHGGFGSGIYNIGTLNVTNSIITGNRGNKAIDNGGGGTATIINSTVSNNLDGGILNNGNLSMTGGLVTGNTNGGIVSGGNSLLNGITITNNSNNSPNFFGGGGIFITGGSGSDSTTVINCQVSNNTTNGSGGGIRNAGAKANLINTTISGNTSNVGGGLQVVDGGLGNTIAINLTITGNRANLGGGVAQDSGPVLLKNSLVAGNFYLTGTTANDIFGSVDASSSFNLIGTGGSGGLNDGVNNNQVGVADPRLGPLADNGGATFTHSLLSNSTALDAADNCVTQVAHCGIPNISQLTTDQRGFNRLVDCPDADTSATVDIGAYEAQPTLAELTDTTSNEDVQLIVPFEASDPSTITGLTANSSNSTLVPNDSAHLTAVLKGSTGLVTITPAANLFGTTNITVTVNRTGGGSDSKTFLLTVNSSNDAPTFIKGTDQLVFEDAGLQTVTNWATAMSPGPADESGQSLSFQVTNNTNAGMFSSGPAIDSSGTLTYTPGANANGSATITIVLKDNGGTTNGGVDTSAPQTFKININPVNDAPSFTAPDRTVNEDFFSQIPSAWATNVSAGAPDESDQSLTFQITSNSNPGLFAAGPTVRFDGALSFTPVSNAFGSAVITILLKDNGGTANGGSDISSEKTFTITVNPVNDAPSFTRGRNQTNLINAGAQTIANWATNISAGPANESGQTLNFQVTAVSNPSLFTVLPSISPTGTLTYQAAADTAGTSSITIDLKDDGGTANGGRDASVNQAFAITVAAVLVRFDSANLLTNESSNSTTATVSRTGDLSRVVTVDYATGDDPGFPCSSPFGTASPKCDFTAAFGTLTFAAGEATKTIRILINQDSYVEGQETFGVSLSKATNGSALASPALAIITIDDDAVEQPGNSIDDAGNFVRQHYHDFLNREPDESGLAFWTSEITSCGANQSCIELKRINVSAAFYLSIEFQQTGYLVERIYKTAYADASGTSTFGGTHQLAVPMVRANEFLFDTQEISKGVVVGVGDWEQQLENNKQAFTAEYVLRSRFTTAFPVTMTAAQFVDKLNANAGSPLSQSERDQLVNELATSVKTRAQVLRAVAEDSDLFNAETNRAFVLMQYFGYLRRNPNDPQDNDYTGFDFWLTKLNQFNGNFLNAEMVKAFIASGEYRHRFGP